MHSSRGPRLDSSIASVSVRSSWGYTALPDRSRVQSILTVADHEYLIACGSTLSFYRDGDNKTTKMLMPQVAETCSATMMTLSNDSSQLAVGFKKKGGEVDVYRAVLYLYDVKSQYTGIPSKPRVLEYTHVPPSLGATATAADFLEEEQHQFVCAAFSNDNVFLVCTTNIVKVGCLVFDTAKGEIVIRVPTTAAVSFLSFNPRDAQKLCTLGDKCMFQLWRLASKNVHPSPIHGLTRSSEYTCQVWLDGPEARIIAGSTDGFLVIVQGTEQLQPPTYAFGAPGQVGAMPSKVASLLNRGDYVVAVSEYNYFAIFEIKRFSASGAHAATAVLIPLGVCKVSDVDAITGMQWAIKASTSSLQHSFVSVIASQSALCMLDLKADTLGSKAGIDTGSAAGPSVTISGRAGANDLLQTPVDLRIVKSDKQMANFHHGPINSFALSKRNCTFVTASNEDESVRVRNFSIPNGPCQVTKYFSEFKNQVSNFVDIHPTGLFLASACEDEAVEFMITENSIGAVRRIPVKMPLTLPNGQPFVNTQHVSLVRYSHSGNLLAVVTGKYVRIFDMLRLQVSSTDLTGSPTTLMFLMDNTASVLDIAFSTDDKRVFTAAADGFVYSWLVGESTRSGEFNCKGVPATKIAVDEDGLIAVVFESEAEAPTQANRRGSMRVSIGPSTGKKSLVNARTKPSSSRKNSNFSKDAAAAFLAVGDVHTDAAAATDSTGVVTAGAAQRFLMTWEGNVTVNGGESILLGSPVSAIALGTIDAPLKKRVCVLGLFDGRVLVSVLPFPLQAIAPPTVTMTSLSPPDQSISSYLDESHCKILQLHKDAVSCVSIAPTGLWIFTAGRDGAVHMLSTSMRARDMIELPEKTTVRENDFILTEKDQLSSLRERIGDIETVITELKRDSERTISKLTESSLETKTGLESRLKREVKQRDDIILRGREDMLKSTRQLHEEIKQIKVDHAREISELESMYERKLSKESLYLENMRQAYDEFVLHARMDMTDLKKEVEQEKEQVNQKQSVTFKEMEKQKTALLLYVDFVNERNKELLNAQEERQEEERGRFKEEISDALKLVEKSQKEGRSDIATLSIQNGKLKHTVTTKEDDILRLQSDLGWANDRIKKLETAVQEAAVDMKKKADLAERWEFKVGETQQQISELERIRKALTSQLHALRQELGPKEEKLSEVSERLQEVDREYELSLNAISEKEKTLSQHGQNLALLQKQVREYRNLSGRRDASLRRAAKLLDEFKLTLEEAQFQSYKTTIPAFVAAGTSGEDEEVRNPATEAPVREKAATSTMSRRAKGEVVEIMARSEGMDAALGRLSELLAPFSKGGAVIIDVDEDAVMAHEERERHMKLLHKNIRGLQNNLENTGLLVQAKVGSHLADNKVLLQELNSLRQQVRSLSMENQRLAAKVDMDLLQRREPTSPVVPKGKNREQEWLQGSQSDSSLQREGSLASLSKGHSKSTDSNVIHMTGSMRHGLSVASIPVENLSNSLTLEAQETKKSAVQLRDQVFGQLAKVRNSNKSREKARLSTAEAKIDAIFRENEQAIASTAAGEILAAYQSQINAEGKDAKLTKGDNGKKTKVVATVPVPRKAVPLSHDKNNKHVALPEI